MKAGLMISLMIWVGVYLSACSGGKFCMSLNQIDEVSESQKLSQKK